MASGYFLNIFCATISTRENIWLLGSVANCTSLKRSVATQNFLLFFGQTSYATCSNMFVSGRRALTGIYLQCCSTVKFNFFSLANGSGVQQRDRPSCFAPAGWTFVNVGNIQTKLRCDYPIKVKNAFRFRPYSFSQR